VLCENIAQFTIHDDDDTNERLHRVMILTPSISITE